MSCITRYAERLSSYLKSGYDAELSASNQVFLNAHKADIASVLDTGILVIDGKNHNEIDFCQLGDNFYYKWSYIRTFTKILRAISMVALAVFVSVTAAGIAAIITTGAIIWLSRRVNQSKTWLNLFHAFDKQTDLHMKRYPIRGLLKTDNEGKFRKFIDACLPTNRDQVVDLYINSTDLRIRELITNLACFINNPRLDNGTLNKALFDKLEWMRDQRALFRVVFGLEAL